MESGPDLTAAALDALDDLFYVFDSDGSLRRWNAEVPSVTGYDEAELASMSVTEFFAESEAERIAEAFETVLEERRRVTVEAELVTAEGDRIPHEFTGSPLEGTEGPGGPHVVGVGRDVSDRRWLQRRLRENEERLSQLASYSEDVLWMFDADWEELLFVNDAYEEVFGRTVESLEADPPSFLEAIHPEDRKRVREAMERVSGGEQVEIEYRVNSSEEYGRWVWVQGAPVFEDDEVTRVVGFTRDITERKARADRLQRQNEELRLLNRIVRHDIRNDLSIVVGWLSYLQDVVPAEHRDDLHRAVQAGEHAVELTYSLNDLLRLVDEREAPELSAVDLRRVLLAEVERARDTYPDETVTVDGEIPEVDVRANAMLAAVFRNLLNNAVLHNDREGLRVTVSADDRGGTVRVAVADNGSGIADERKDELFDRGLAASEGEEGSGVGLYLVSTVVEAFGGESWVEDNEPTGSVFHVELPTAE